MTLQSDVPDVPRGWWLFGQRVPLATDDGWPRRPKLWLWLLQNDFVSYCITKPGWKGGWRYLNEWAAITAFMSWDGAGAPPAGTWMDFN